MLLQSDQSYCGDTLLQVTLFSLPRGANDILLEFCCFAEEGSSMVGGLARSVSGSTMRMYGRTWCAPLSA